ncbi:leucine-rich repeat domain-containing protein, partial [Escherichia coli]|nr:leucine-rich repeat domain-containing protein [Escherichia coli]
MKFPSIFNKIKPQSIQQHPEKNQLNWMLELNKWKEERILTGEIHRPECRNEAAKRINCAFLSKQNDIDLSGLNLSTQPPGLQNFTSINLDNNQLTHFDATNYDRLVKLSLNSNTLESINIHQGRNVSITHISMNNNCLRNIDIDRLSSITYFSAAHNKLASLHNALFPNLNTLLINNNLLSEIKMFYSNFCKVQTLNAANNQLEKINLHFLTYLSSIKSLRLDNNKITRIDTENTSDIRSLFPIIKKSESLNFLNISGENNCPTIQLMLFNLFSPALKLNTGLAILSPGAFEDHSDGLDVDNELFHY